MFNARIESSIERASLEREYSRRRGGADTGDGIAVVTYPAALQRVLDQADGCFRRWARSAKSTEDFDGIFQLMSDVRGLLYEKEPVRTSMILDLTGRMSHCEIREQLPESMCERKRALDEVLQNLGHAIEPEQGLYPAHLLFAKAAQAYLANDWMHDRWLAKLLAREMLSKMRSSLAVDVARWRRWSTGLLVVGCVAFLASKAIGILMAVAGGIAKGAGIFMLAAGVVAFVVAGIRDAIRYELDFIILEVGGGCGAGGVVAERLERLNGPRLRVPSILVELLRLQRY